LGSFMAVIKKNILGDISGRLGNYTYRVRNGKPVKYRRPVKQRVSRSGAAVSARNDFAMTVKLAAFINSFPALKRIWKNAKVPGSTHFQKIIKNNSASVKLFGISAKNIIAPPGIPFKVNELSLSANNIKFNIPVNSNELKRLFSKPVVIHIIFYFHSPVKESGQPYCFSGMVTELHAFPGSNACTINPGLDNETVKNLREYNKAVIYFSVSMLNPAAGYKYRTSSYAEVVEF
jgi:hypothetical protein